MESLWIVGIGFVSGAIGTAIMSIIQYPFFRRWGVIGILEWHENQSLMSMILKKDYRLLTKEGFIFHFVNGGLAAIFYAWIVSLKIIDMNATLLGTIFGILLWILTLAPIHKPITGVSILKHPLGIKPSILSLVSHTIYGIIVANVVALWLG